MPATKIAGAVTLICTPPEGYFTVLKRIVVSATTGGVVTVYDTSVAIDATLDAGEAMFLFNLPATTTYDIPNINITTRGSGTSGKIYIDVASDATAVGVVYYDHVGFGVTPA